MIPVEERLIISLFDYSGKWSEPYRKVGYPLIRWDKRIEGDILGEQALQLFQRYSSQVYGILAAPPCTYFAASGAQHWPKIAEVDLSGMIALAQIVLVIRSWCDNLKFWALENPVGRIEKVIPELKPHRQLTFNPCDYGDPYTKKTILWGEFNRNLYQTPVLNLYGSMMHKVPAGPNRQAIRSATPKGFANAFFQANQ